MFKVLACIQLATRELHRREAAQGKPNVPVAMLAANVTREFVALSVKAGTHHHTPKPGPLETLVSEIKTCLALASSKTLGPSESRAADRAA